MFIKRRFLEWCGDARMGKIYVVLARHEKKEKLEPKPTPGGEQDRTLVGLSEAGHADAFASGQRELGGKSIDRAVVVHSGFLRTEQTAEKWLRGAGVMDDLYGDADRYQVVADSAISLAGTIWDPECFPPFGDKQEVLNVYVEHALANHYLAQADDPNNAARLPILARKAVAVLENLVRGAERLSRTIQGRENGLVIQVTHGPIVDAAAMAFNGGINLEQLPDSSYGVAQLLPFVAHREGEYVVGVINVQERQPIDDAVLALNIKGTQHERPMEIVRRDIERLKYMAFGGVQRHS